MSVTPDAARALSVVVVAAALGLFLPDFDLALPLISHRSALTHSLVPALVALAFGGRAIAAGLALGIGLHLAADLFPAGMYGTATIKLPFTGSIGMWSYGFIAANMAGGAALGLWLVTDIGGHKAVRAAAVAGSVAAVLYVVTRGEPWLTAPLYALALWAADRFVARRPAASRLVATRPLARTSRP